MFIYWTKKLETFTRKLLLKTANVYYVLNDIQHSFATVELFKILFEEHDAGNPVT